jgi:hypothetical protein
MMSYAVVYMALAVTAAPGPTDLPPHPRLLLDQKGIEQLKHKIETRDWAKTNWQLFKKRADEAMQKKVELPPRGGNWYHWYACPTHGVRLTRGKQVGPWQWEHVCPVGDHILTGDPKEPSRDYDGCAINGIHDEWAKAVRDLGLVYQVTGDAAYARKAREILLAYAAAYPTYPLHDNWGHPKVGGGKEGSQSLDESVWLIPMCQGADMVWDTLSDDDRRMIADNIFLPAVNEVILPHKFAIHNIQCWKNSAVGLVGMLLGDQNLISNAIDDPDRGYRVQMSKGVTSDGGWWEGAWGYHFYTMSALWPLTEAARNCGIDLYGPEFRRMFDAPLRFAMPNLRLPAFSDSGEVDLTASRGIYELGYARYKDPGYLTLISGAKRESDYSLLYGADDLPGSPEQRHKSANYPASGYAILASGEGKDATWLCFKYGPYGGGHGHPDKLSFVLYSQGRDIAIDPGTALYGLPVQGNWYKTSLAHNTLIVDEVSQKPVDGKLIDFGSKKGVEYVTADAGDIYDGVRYVRTIALLNPDLVVVIDRVKSEKPAILDIAYHQAGRWIDLPSGEPWSPPDKPGYSHLRDAAVHAATGAVSLATQVDEQHRVAMTILADQGSQIITAAGLTSNSQDSVPCAIVRRHGLESCVVWAISLDGKPVHVERAKPGAEVREVLPEAEYTVRSHDGKVWRVAGGVTDPIR